MQDKSNPDKLSSDKFFWVGIFASPFLSCVIFSLGEKTAEELLPLFGILLLGATLVGAFYCGFKVGARCSKSEMGSVLLGLVFTAGFLLLDFIVFFIGCCSLLKL